MNEHLVNVFLGLIAGCVTIAYWCRERRREKEATRKLQAAVSAGLTEPASLHPALDPNRCIGIGSCAEACPEGDIMGIVDGRAELVQPTRCIGHGACAAACPVDALTLVFGTARRGVELPHVKENFETNVDGIYIAGELGGMGLIRNAVTQGREAVDNIAKSLNGGDKAVYDVAIIGAGPAGLAATLQAEKLGLRYITLDQDGIGGTVLNYPRHKLVMTQPMDIPLHGKFRAREIRKEELLALWNEIIEKTGIAVNTHEKVQSVTRNGDRFQLTSAKGEYAVRRVLLAIGRRGSPRKLGVEGEQTSKVAYKLTDPEQYSEKRVLVVGGGDSAVEAALAIKDQPGATVTMSYRKGMFSRIKEKNQQLIEKAMQSRVVDVLFESQVERIDTSSVVLKMKDRTEEILNHYVLVMIGGELPTPFLKRMGIGIEMKFGER